MSDDHAGVGPTNSTPGPDGTGTGPGTLLARVKLHEGFRDYPYDDHRPWAMQGSVRVPRRLVAGDTIIGTVTFGYGFTWISQEEAELVLAMRLERCTREAQRVVGGETWVKLSKARRDVLTEMAFQLGETGLRKFTRTVQHIQAGQFDAAAGEMLASRWGQQTPERAQELSELIRHG